MLRNEVKNEGAKTLRTCSRRGHAKAITSSIRDPDWYLYCCVCTRKHGAVERGKEGHPSHDLRDKRRSSTDSGAVTIVKSPDCKWRALRRGCGPRGHAP